MTLRPMALISVITLFGSISTAHAQVSTGTIAGVIEDAGGAILPGASVVLSSDRLLGGTISQVSDSNGAYGFDRLPPGTYALKFELQGFRTDGTRSVVAREYLRPTEILSPQLLRFGVSIDS